MQILYQVLHLMWFCKLFYSLDRNMGCLRDELNISTPFCTNCVYKVFFKVISTLIVILQTLFRLGRKMFILLRLLFLRWKAL
jgi:hypothetical protein